MSEQAELPIVSDIQEFPAHRVLTFSLTNDEIADRVARAVKLRSQIADIEAEADDAKQVFKGRVAEKTGELSKLYGIEATRQEDRLVNCTERRDFNLGLVQYVFNGTVMEERTMTVGERQTEMKPVLQDNKNVHERTDGQEEPQASDISDVIREETRRSSKHSAVDGPTGDDVDLGSGES